MLERREINAGGKLEMANGIVFTDNSELILAALENAANAALEEIGIRAEGYAKVLTPVGTPESTGVEGYHGGTLRNSITHKVNGDDVYIGTNLDYAPYVELGTGIYASDGTGRKNPWVWTDKNGKKHWTKGMKPNHMLKKAAADHTDEYKNVIEKHLKNA